MTMATSSSTKPKPDAPEGETPTIDLDKPLEGQSPEAKAALDNLAAKPSEAPFKWDFTIQHNIPIPTVIPRSTGSVHPFVAQFDRMGHNDSFFLPSKYWLARGIPAERATKGGWQKQTIGNHFSLWRKKGGETRSKWRLVTVERDPVTAPDPEFPAMAGIRAWMVDTTR